MLFLLKFLLPLPASPCVSLCGPYGVGFGGRENTSCVVSDESNCFSLQLTQADCPRVIDVITTDKATLPPLRTHVSFTELACFDARALTRKEYSPDSIQFHAASLHLAQIKPIKPILKGRIGLIGWTGRGVG